MQRIAVDIDEVLCPFFHPMVRQTKHRIPSKKHPYVYSTALNISENASKKMVRKFYKSETFKNLEPIEYSQEVLKDLSELYELHVVTGRQDEVRNETEKWIHTNFPGIFKSIHLTNSFTSREVSKVDICLSIGIDIIIDDSLENCLSCERKGIKAYNFIGDPPYPWSIDTDISISNWKEISNEMI